MANCAVVDGILAPCPTLVRALQGFGRAKGVSHLEVYNSEKRRTILTGAVLKSGDLPSTGVIMNFCPFCGQPIGDHFHPQEDPTNG